ncbi:MAG TPA: signal peptidase II [Casimicrobiaceae bacterium]|nr:signal peptidase II [Casimicrobiaceae bacterium]
MKRLAHTGGWRWLWLSLAVIVLDRVTKELVLNGLRSGDNIVLAPFLSLVLAFNTGAAFSMFADANGWQRWLFTVVAVVASGVMLWLLRRGGSALFCAGLALIIGGALGNLWDRLTIGKVVDFVLVHWRDAYFPAFNIADSAITIGAAALILDSILTRHATPARES